MRRFGGPLTFCLALGGASAASAAVDAFLWIDGVPGESRERPGWIEVSSFSWGATNPGSLNSGTGAGTGKVAVHDFTVTKTVDRASPLFTKCAASGCHYGKVKLAMRKAGGDPNAYLQYVFDDVIISRHSISSGGDRPSESISFTYGKLEVNYQKQTQGGPGGYGLPPAGHPPASTSAMPSNSGLPPAGPH